MPAHFQRATGTEAHDEGAVGLIFHRLRRMKKKLPCVRRGLGRKAPDHIERLLLENAERPLRVFLQQEILAPPKRLFGDFNSFNVSEPEEAIVSGLIVGAVGNEVVPIAVEEAIRAHELSAESAGTAGPVM